MRDTLKMVAQAKKTCLWMVIYDKTQFTGVHFLDNYFV